MDLAARKKSRKIMENRKALGATAATGDNAIILLWSFNYHLIDLSFVQIAKW